MYASKKQALILLLWIGIKLPIFSQITYTDSSFLQAGDILKIATTADSLMVVTAPSNTVAIWDFSGLVELSYREDTILDASVGGAYAQFLDADILGNLINGFGTAYTEVTPTEIKHIGGGIELQGVDLLTSFSDPFVVQKAPFTYGDSHTDDFYMQLQEHVDSVPLLRELIVDSFGIAIVPDSIRFSFWGTVAREADAFGSCQLPNKKYDVLRQKNIIHTNIKIEMYTSFFGGNWGDVTSLILGQSSLPIPAKDTTIFYDYLAEGYKEPIVRQTMNKAETQVIAIEYRKTNESIAVQKLENQYSLEWIAYPNPAQEQLNIEFKEHQIEGTYLEVVDLWGREQYSQIIEGQTLKINVSKWTAGQYLGIIRNKNNEIIGINKIQVIH